MPRPAPFPRPPRGRGRTRATGSLSHSWLCSGVFFGARAFLREDFMFVTAIDDINALIEIVNERQSGKGLAEQVAAADAGAYQGLLDLAELVDQLAERVARLEYREGDTRSADFASQLTDLSETVDKLKRGLRRAGK
jgi:hypothetical protein